MKNGGEGGRHGGGRQDMRMCISVAEFPADIKFRAAVPKNMVWDQWQRHRRPHGGQVGVPFGRYLPSR